MTVLLRVLASARPVPDLAVVDPCITVLVRQEDLSLAEWDRLFRETNHEPQPNHGSLAPQSLVITDRRSRIERLLRHPIPIGP